MPVGSAASKATSGPLRAATAGGEGHGAGSNDLIDLDNAIIRRQGHHCYKRLNDRNRDRFDLHPARLAGDSSYAWPRRLLPRQLADAEVAGDLLAVERNEAALVWQAQSQNLPTEHRNDCSPLAILQCRLITVPAVNPSPGTSPGHSVNMRR
jgi:hypothetical protein